VFYSLQQVLLQSEEELLSKRSAELASEGAAPKPKKIIGKMKVQGILSSFVCHYNLFVSILKLHMILFV